MIESGVNAAFVHSSTASHPEVIRTFLANHIPVYVDKPIADNLAEVEELTRLAEEQNTLLMTGFNRRYAPKYQELKALTDTNMIIMQKIARRNRVRLVHLFMTILFMSLIPCVFTRCQNRTVTCRSGMARESSSKYNGTNYSGR